MSIQFHTRKHISAKAKLFFVIAYIVVVTLFDSYSYGIIYQQKIKQEGYTNPVWSWVFQESADNGIITVPHYRIIQKSVEIAGLIIIFFYCGLWCTIGILIAHYLLSFDLLFYIVLNQTHLFTEFEKANSTYWLQYPYQAGYFLLQPFSTVKFYIMGFAGIIFAICSCFVKNLSFLQRQESG